jgi:hypothetical protein
MKNLKFILFSMLALVLTFSTPTISIAQEETKASSVEQLSPSDSANLVAETKALFEKIKTIGSSGKEIPDDAKALVQNIAAEIKQAPTPINKNTIEYWINFIGELVEILLAGITGTVALAEGLGIVKKDILAKIIPAVNKFRKRWLVLIAAVIMTILSLTIFKGEGNWSYIEAGAFLLPILFGAVKTNISATKMGLKDTSPPLATT